MRRSDLSPTRAGNVRRIRLIVVLTSEPMPISDLPMRDRARVATPGNPSGEHRAGFLASRRARHLALSLARPDGVDDRRAASIAHTGALGVCAAALNPMVAELAGVGVDAEPLRMADARTARFFLDEREQAHVTSTPPGIRSAEHVRLWTTKEAMFKSDPANGERVLRDYHLHRPEAPAGSGWRDAGVDPGPDLGFGYINGTVAGIALTVALAVDRSAAADQSSPRRNVSAPTVTFEAVAERISEILSVPVERLSPDSTLADLAADSFLLVEMVVDLQEEFDAIFTQADLRQITQLSELVSLLQSHAGGGDAPGAARADRLGD